MSVAPVPPHAGPPWRALALLAVAVFIAHTLVLTTVPARFGPERLPPSETTQVFVTRSIPAAPPPAEPAAAPRKTVLAAPKEPVKEAVDPVAASAPPPPPPVFAPDAPATEDIPAAETAAIAPVPEASAPEAAAAGPEQAPVTAMAVPESVNLEYVMSGSAKGLTYHAKAELRWRNTGTAYDALMRVSALFLGSRSMTSTGQVGPDGLEPMRFSDKSRTEVAAHFEADKNQISFSANTPTLPWVKGAQDRVSVFIQLSGMLASNPAGFPLGSTVSIYTVGPRDADTWTFLVETGEKLTLPFGELPTVKLARQPRREFDQKVEVWYAPSLGYLPVRTRITQANGDFVDQQLSGIGKE